MTDSGHPQPWNTLRTWGPLTTARWDPHPEPTGEHAPEGAAYLAFDVTTCLAEVFQSTRFVDIHGGSPYVTLLAPTRSLKLLDLRGNWLLKAGATAAVATGAKRRTRKWARAIREAWPDLDGIWSRSAVAGAGECVTLWRPALDSLPLDPLSSNPLDSPALGDDIKSAAESIGFGSNCP